MQESSKMYAMESNEICQFECGRLREVAPAQEGDVVVGKEEDVVQVVGHTAVFAVNEVEGGAEVFGADTHKSLNNIHFGLTSSAGNDLVVESLDERLVGQIGAVEILDDGVAIYAQGEEYVGGTPAGAVFPLETMPEHGALGCLDDESQEGGVLELRELASDERGVHHPRHVLHLGVERVVDDMALEVEEGLFGDGAAGLLLRPHVDGRERVVRGSFHFAVGQVLRLAQRAEIEDASEVELLPQASDVLVGSVVQVGGTKQKTASYHLAFVAL